MSFKEDWKKLLNHFDVEDRHYRKKYKESFNNRPSDKQFEEMSKLSNREKATIRFYYCGMDISFLMYEQITNNLKEYYEKNNITFGDNSSTTEL